MKRTMIAMLLLASLISNAVHAQRSLTGPFVLEGDLSALEAVPQKVMVTYRKLGGGFIFDSCVVISRKFRIERNLDQPVLMTISLVSTPASRDYFSSFYLPGEAKLVAGKSISNSTLSGTATTEADLFKVLMDGWDKSIAFHNKQIGVILASDNTKQEKEKRIQQLKDSVDRVIDSHLNFFYYDHKESPVAVYALMQYASRPEMAPRRDLDPRDMQMNLNALPERFHQLPAVKTLMKEVALAKSMTPGNPAFEFTLPDTAGKQVHLADFRGQYVLIDFWASWCAPCRRENPNVIQAFQKYKNKGFTVISISLDKAGMGAAWRNAIQKDNITAWTHLSDLTGFANEVAVQYGIRAIPTNFLVGPDGRFLGRNLFGDALQDKLAEVLHDTAALVQSYYKKAARGTEMDLRNASRDFGLLGYQKQTDSLLQAAIVLFPKGYTAFNIRKNAIGAAEGLSNKLRMLEGVVHDFPEMHQKSPALYDMDYRSHAVMSMRAGDSAQAFYCRDRIYNGMQRILVTTEIARVWAEKEQYVKAISWLQPALDTVAFNPANLNMGIQYAFFSYSDWLYKARRYEEALKYIGPMYQEKKDTDIQLAELYVSLLLATGRNKEALPVMARMIEKGMDGVAVRDSLPVVYRRVNGGVKGYEQFLRPLKAAGREAKNSKLAKGMLNEAAPAFTLQDLNGKEVSLASLKGKTVLLDFWGTFCKPCIKAFPLMQQAMQEYKSDTSIVFLFVNVEYRDISRQDRCKDIREVMQSKKVVLPVLLDECRKEPTFCKVHAALRTEVFPAKIIIDKNGIIRFRVQGAEADANNEMESIHAMIDIARKAS